MHKFYDELAKWWYLISAPEDYAEEAQFFLKQFAEVTAQWQPSLLELGSGGGNNAYHMRSAFAYMMLTDLSPQMIALSRSLNPTCEHSVGDMRTLRLGREFDAVFIHDAIDYMTTLEELRQAMLTAYVHCKAGGMALFVPDHVLETFEPSTEHGGHDGEERKARYLEWSHPITPNASTYRTDYIFVLKEGEQATHTIHETHTLGLFSRADWLRLLTEVGFLAQIVHDPYEREIFIGHKVTP